MLGLKYVIYCISALRVKSLSYKPHLPSKYNVLGGRSSRQDPWTREPNMGLEPLLFGKNLCNFVYPPIYRSAYLGVQVLIILHLCPF